MVVFFVFLVLLAALPEVAAPGITDYVNNIWLKILKIGDLSAIGLGNEAVIVNFSRLLLALTIFAVFFGIMTTFGGANGRPFGFLNRNQAMIVAGLLAILGAIFLPVQIILAIGGAWATAIAALLIGGPVAGLGFLLWNITGPNGQDTRATVFLKLFLCIVLFWILTVMHYHLISGLKA